MTAAELEIKVTTNVAEIEKLKAKLNEVKTTTSQTQSGFKNMAASFLTAQIGLQILNKGFDMFKTALIGGIKAAADSIKEQTLLANAMQKTGTYTREAFNEIKDYASELQRLTVYDDDAIIAGQRMLVTFGAQGDQLKQLTKATLDLASAKGMDLNSAFNLVSKSIGSETNALGRYGIQIDGAAGSTERMQLAVDNISKLFGGTAASSADNLAGRLQQLNEVNNDIFQSMGTSLQPILKSFTESMLKGSNAVNDFLSNEENLKKIFNVIKGLSLIFYSVGKAIHLNFKIMYDMFINPFIVAGKVLYELIKPLGFVVDGIKDIVSNIMDKLKPAIDFFGGLFDKAKKKVNDFVEKGAGKVKDAISKIIPDPIKEAGINALNKLGNEFEKTKDSYINYVDELIAGEKKIIGLQITPAIPTGQGGGVDDGSGVNEEAIKKRLQAVQKIKDQIAAAEEQKSKNQIQINFDFNMSSFKSQMSEVASSMATFNDTLINGIVDSFNKVYNMVANQSERIAELMAKGLSEGAAKATSAFEMFAVVFKAVGDSVVAGLDIIKSGFEEFYNDQLEKLSENHDLQIEAIDERLARELELIEYGGQTKKEFQQQQLADLQTQLAIETDATKKKDLAEQISGLQKEMAIADAQKKALKEKENADKKYAKEKYKQELELFNIKKGLDIAAVGVSMATGIVAAWASAAAWPGPSMIAGMALAGVLTGLITSLGIAQIALIASKQPPPPPKFARGTEFAPGGLSLVGERGAELMNVPRGASITPADQTSAMLNRPIILHDRLVIDGREFAEIVRTVNVNNNRIERSRV